MHVSSDNTTATNDISASLAALISGSIDDNIRCQDLLDQLSRRGHPPLTPEEDHQNLLDEVNQLVLKKVQAQNSDLPSAKNHAWFGSRKFASAIGVQNDSLAILLNGRVSCFRSAVLSSVLSDCFNFQDCVCLIRLKINDQRPSSSCRIQDLAAHHAFYTGIRNTRRVGFVS